MDDDGLTGEEDVVVDEFGWSADQMVRRFVMLGLACLLAVIVVYAWGVWSSYKKAQA